LCLQKKEFPSSEAIGKMLDPLLGATILKDKKLLEILGCRVLHLGLKILCSKFVTFLTRIPI
jgi:hypothetical protein